jgi:hypothetical protein
MADLLESIIYSGVEEDQIGADTDKISYSSEPIIDILWYNRDEPFPLGYEIVCRENCMPQEFRYVVDGIEHVSYLCFRRRFNNQQLVIQEITLPIGNVHTSDQLRFCSYYHHRPQQFHLVFKRGGHFIDHELCVQDLLFAKESLECVNSCSRIKLDTDLYLHVHYNQGLESFAKHQVEELQPVVHSIYPLDSQYPPAILMFIHPSGITFRERMAGTVRINSFVMTSNVGVRNYAVSLYFYEKHQETGWLIQKSLTISSSLPFYQQISQLLLNLLMLSTKTLNVPLEHHLLHYFEGTILLLFVILVPQPVPGKFQVMMPLEHGSYNVRFALPEQEDFPLNRFPLHLLFFMIDIPSVCYMFKLLLLERKIVFVSKQQGKSY